jgi:DNA-binding LytR/AlgR family response regulator
MIKRHPFLFLSASPEFALESYAVRAVNYVLKPISSDKLFSILDELVEQIEAEKNEDAIIVKSTEGIQKILISSLVFVEVIGRNVLYHLLSGRVIECIESFSSACDSLLKFNCFIKPHRSYLVNMQYIEAIHHNQITLRTLSTIPIVQGKTKDIKAQYLAYQMEGND